MDSKDFLNQRQRAYQAIFTEGPAAEIVLADLLHFCRGCESTFHPDPRVSANLDGRREVFLRICHHLNLDTEKLWKLYGGASQ